MKFKLDLLITVAMMSLVTVTITIFAVAVYYFNDEVEQQTLDTVVREEFAGLERHLNETPLGAVPDSAQLQVWYEPSLDSLAIPLQLRKLPLGMHHDVRWQDQRWHVLRASLKGQFATIAYNIDEVERYEELIDLVLLIGAIVASLLTLGISIWISRYLSRPVRALSERLAALDPTEREVRISREFHGHEVEAIAASFDRYLERLDRFVEREQLFVAAASHELRTPLSVIQSSSEILEDDPRLPDVLRPAVQRIGRSVANMSALLASLLMLSRENERSRLIGEDPLEEIQRVVDDHRQLFESRGMRLEFEVATPPNCQAPEGYFAIAVGNLLRNAALHSGGTAARLSVTATHLCVTDDGTGIASEARNLILDKRFRSPGADGSGLGLFIVKHVCDREGWKIDVTSSPSGGTMVVIDWSRTRDLPLPLPTAPLG